MNAIEIVKNYLNKKGLKQSYLAERMDVSRQYINGILTKNKDIDCGTLKEISEALEYDFFSELSKELPKNIRQSSNNPTSIVDTAIIDLMKERFPKILK